MRNALVLILLCIGLTSAFIVPSTTSTSVTESQVEQIRERMLKFKREFNVTTARGEFENATTSLDILHLDHNKENEMKKELYDEVSEENKIINERSFIFVNQAWRKFPMKSQSMNSMKPNCKINDKKNVYNRDIKDAKSANEKKSNKADDSNDTENNRSTKQRLKNFFLVFHKPSNASNFSNNTKKIDHKSSLTFKNDLIFKDSHQQNIISTKDVLWANQHVQHTLEEQTPDIESLVKKYEENLRHLKYCQNCMMKEKFPSAGTNMGMECKCKCGRFIHLKEAPNFNSKVTLRHKN